MMFIGLYSEEGELILRSQLCREFDLTSQLIDSTINNQILFNISIFPISHFMSQLYYIFSSKHLNRIAIKHPTMSVNALINYIINSEQHREIRQRKSEKQ